MYSKRMAGVTLVELIIAIVIVGAALAGLVAAFTAANRASVDPVITQQMLAIGESMMEEVLLKPFAVDNAAAATRADFNDVRDYDMVDDANPGFASTGITDVDGAAIEGLETYNVSVQVNRNGVALNNVAAGDALRVTVRVTHGVQQLALTGWRTAP
ncbi:type IV pilus modification PilV family protein [Telluria aromaticivorans]|uniref:Prepilin-type cleavage/methylation domain-containing protein n=1 Tax=Telluria aromaticivorans TaxID=2725995 RepID=A0A7Y2P2J6_9BURK|nr:prepilin-type N-terminal cleavage/methylation domain-containing protein [Telluria aromaticivorans]NNG25706.1 prepilin-type cleavage/methylation domain-containing protein [Telluria aromaticivorans]